MEQFIYILTLYFTFNISAALLIYEDMSEMEYSETECTVAFLICVFFHFFIYTYGLISSLWEHEDDRSNHN